MPAVNEFSDLANSAAGSIIVENPHFHFGGTTSIPCVCSNGILMLSGDEHECSLRCSQCERRWNYERKP